MPTKQTREFRCQQCRQPFQTTEYRSNRLPKFCSRQCRDDARRTRVTLACRQCSQPFQRKRYQETWSQDRGPFCSMPCYGAWQRENIRGESSPSWGLESNPNGRGSHRWVRNRLAALERDGNRCVECGSTQNLHVHHVEPWTSEHPDPHALGNLATLCALHHRQVHKALDELS